MKRNHIFALLLMASMPVMAQQKDSVDIGANRVFSMEETTAAISVIKNNDLNKRTAKNIGNAILGQGLGLISKQGSGNYDEANPVFYVRGLQSMSSSSPLILVDGIERDINNVSAEEVESVMILKDAAAVALYGYKGTNGAILITTKRGKVGKNTITISYDHSFNFMSRKPEFVDALTYANAMNEARANDGLPAMYSNEALNAIQNGTMPYSYPNVNWVDETFREQGITNRYNVEFRGGSQKFQYYTMMGLISDKGFIDHGNMNEGYSTQNKYVRGNLRVNFDAQLTRTTQMKVNLFGVLSESSRPGSAVNLWNLVYTVPSVAFPIRTENGLWGGNSTWSGEKNPVAQAQGAAYSKNHNRSLFADLTLDQDLSAITKGLSATVKMAYDNAANIYEDHSKTFQYGMAVPGIWQNGQPSINNYVGGKDSEMGTDAKTNDYYHRFQFNIGLNYDRIFGNHSVYSQVRWDYDNEELYGIGSTVYRQNLSWYTHYGYKNRYYADLAMVYSGSSRLAPDTKWAFSPTLSLAWLASEEDFLKNATWLNHLKLRASAGFINADYLPEDTWTYYLQSYNTNGGIYNFTSNYSTGGIDNGTTLGRLATINPSHEKAYKYNVGIDARLFNGLSVTLDGFYQHRTGIWVLSDGKYTDLVGYDKPYENAGIVNHWGFEVGLDYEKNFNELVLNVGGNLNLNRSKIVEQLEEPKLYDNLVKTNHRLNQIFGLQAIGFFQDEADIANSPQQTFSAVRPGDIKYKDVNGDKVIDDNDAVALGYNTVAPELFYNFHLGMEWKGLGVYVMFQGVGRYSAILNTKSMFWPLINNTNLSVHAYENRWTTGNTEAKYPRLSSESNSNNYQTNSIWVTDRSFLKLRNVEIYYNLPRKLMKKTKYVNGAKLYLRGTDLFCFDKIDITDPEIYGATNPVNKSIVAGLAITF